MKVGKKSTLTMAEIGTVCKTGSFIHVLKTVSTRITEKRWSAQMI